MKINKGEPGYLYARKKKYGIQSCIGFGIVIAILVFGIIKTGSRLNLFTIIAILGCLPSAKVLVEFLVMFPIKSVDKKIVKDIRDKANNLTVAYDMVITSTEHVMPVDVIVISGKKIFGYSSNKKTDVNEVANHIKSTLAQNGIYKTTVKVFPEYVAFLSRAEGLSSMVAIDGMVDEELETNIKDVILTLTM